FATTDEGICAPNCPNVFRFAENNRSSSARKTGAAVRNISRRQLPRGVSRPKQSRVCVEMWRVSPGTGGNGILAGASDRRKLCRTGKTVAATSGMRRADGDLCAYFEAVQRDAFLILTS